MQPADPHAVLLAHDRWANEQFYQACAKLTTDQFHHPFEIGTGSLHNNLIHILSWTRVWTDVLAGSDARPRLEAKSNRYTVADLEQLNQEVSTEFESAALSGSFGDILRPKFGSTVLTFTRGGLLAHVTTHAVHHRAQCLSMLRQLGIKKRPKSSVYEWMLSVYPAE